MNINNEKKSFSKVFQQSLRHHFRAALLQTKLSREELPFKLGLDESILDAIRVANDAALNKMEALNVSMDTLGGWIKTLGYLVFTEIQLEDPYRNIGKPEKRVEVQITSKRTH